MTSERRSIVVLEPHQLKKVNEDEEKRLLIKSQEERVQASVSKKRKHKENKNKVYLNKEVIRKSDSQKTHRKKRTRLGGKASGRITDRKPNAAPKIEDKPTDFDAFGRYKYFTTKYSARIGIHTIAVSIDKLEMAYPDLNLDVVDQIPPHFEAPLRLPPHATIQNVVAKFILGKGTIPFMDYVCNHPHVQYNPSAFAAVTIRVKNGCAALAFCSRSMVCTGTKSETSACNGASVLLLLFSIWGVPCSLHDFIVENIVASTQIGFALSLTKLHDWAKAYDECELTRYEPDLFPGLTFRSRRTKVVFLVFLRGKLVVTGSRFASQIVYMLSWFYYNVLIKHRDDTAHGSSSDYRIAQNMNKIKNSIKVVNNSKKSASVPAGDIDIDEEELARENAQIDEIIREHGAQSTSFNFLPEEIENARAKIHFIPTDGYASVITRRREEILRLAEESEKEYGNDYGLRKFASDDISMVWWHKKQPPHAKREDPRWYSTTLAARTELTAPVFDEMRSSPIVDAKKYLCLKYMRLRHKVLTGHDNFDPVILDMLVDCARDEAYKRRFGCHMEVEEQPNLFVHKESSLPHSAYWERTDDLQVMNHLERVRENLSCSKSLEPPSSWAEVSEGAPPLPTYKRKLRNVYDNTELDKRQARFQLYS